MPRNFYFHCPPTKKIHVIPKQAVEADMFAAENPTSRRKEPKPKAPADDGEKRKRFRPMFFILALIAAALLLLLAELARAEGPKYVAGASFFDSSVKGSPLTWSQGAVVYYTDQGNLSAILAGSDADAFVADAFARWTSVSTAAISRPAAAKWQKT